MILRAYEASGPTASSRLRGMFAFALWDGRRRRLFLARDRAGIKPLVYCLGRPAPALRLRDQGAPPGPECRAELDSEALRDYLTFLYVPSPRTIFRGIRKLPPASYLVLDADGGEPEVHRYWDLRFPPESGGARPSGSKGSARTSRTRCRATWSATCPSAPSSAAAWTRARWWRSWRGAAQGRVRTFSIGFDEADFDELAYARQVARRYGTDHYEFVVKPDALEVLPRLAWQFDEPFADSSALPTYYVSKITREHVTVALSGDGGDENFAGYRALCAGPGAARRGWTGCPARSGVRCSGSRRRLLPAGARGQGYLELLGADPSSATSG